jgi:hypothetical protein
MRFRILRYVAAHLCTACLNFYFFKEVGKAFHNRKLWRIVFVHINIVIRNMCFNIMTPVKQLICESGWRKSTNTFGPKMRQLF